MVAGPEVARMTVEFEDFNMHPRNQEETRHHEETPSVQNTFARDVRPLVAVIEELGNPFEEDSQDLLVLDTKEIADPAVIETVRNAKQIVQAQFEAFSKECIVDRTKSIEEAIHRKKLPLFATKRGPKIPKGNQQVKSLKNDVARTRFHSYREASGLGIVCPRKSLPSRTPIHSEMQLSQH